MNRLLFIVELKKKNKQTEKKGGNRYKTTPLLTEVSRCQEDEQV